MLYKNKHITKYMELKDNTEDYQYINNPHDKIFRKVLDNKKEAVQIINRVLREEDKITEKEIEKYTSNYISSDLKNSEADVVYKIKDKEVFFLIEHQTKVDYSMPYRILKYEIEIMESSIDKNEYKNKTYEYPVVIPIVLYTGKQKWNAKLDLREMQFKWKKYEAIELSRYNILDINEIENDELLKEKDVISKLMIIEKSKTKEEFNKNFLKICEELKRNKDSYSIDEKELLSKAIKAIISINMANNENQKLVKKLDIWKEKDNMQVVEMLQREMKKERIIGRRLGLEEGRKETKVEMIKNMKKNNLSIKTISLISGLNDEEIKEILKN